MLRYQIENKKWAGLQPSQLIRYHESIRHRNSGNHRLVFLGPSNYKLPDSEKPEGLVVISYKDLIKWIDEEYVETDSCEREYLEHLKSYFEAVEMKPFSKDEVQSLVYFSGAEKKMMEVVRQLSDDFGTLKKPQPAKGNFLLGHLSRDNFSMYYGIRYGSEWYFKEPLLENSPELIVYLKDTWDDVDQEKYNLKLNYIYNNIPKDPKHFRIDHYPRKGKDECRLAIRKPLIDFEGKDISEILKWFRSMIVLLLQNLEGTTNSIVNEPQ